MSSFSASKIWDWAETCDPENVTEDEVYKLFHLLTFPEGCTTDSETGRCRKQALCKINPYCLATVTPPTLYKSIRESKKELEKLKEINEAQRQESEYVGLDNLGATCYVNSYLQMWFHTAPFRHLILSYKPPLVGDNDKEHDDSIDATIHQLRVLFAQMLLTKKRSLLPDAFIETLGLDPSNQQDAQEFSNLWMGLLQHRFGSSFNRLFCGSCDVSIVCDSCGMASRKPDEFSELILNVPAADALPQTQIGVSLFENSPSRRQGGSSVNLEDVLRRYFGDEVLDGDNAYECSFTNCGKKGRAIRHTRLLRAPAILNAQVLRFAFDPIKLTRRKLRTQISFPEHLELRREYFTNDSPELKQVNLPRYRIKAILCHIGTSVVRGHYTARIRLRDGWYMFNDAVVKKGDPTSGGDGGVDADESGGSAGRRFRSADAYCIVYHRVDAPELRDDDDLTKDAEVIPADLRDEVNDVEERFRSELEKRRDEVVASSDAREAVREQRLRIRREMAVRLPHLEQLASENTVAQVKKMLTEQPGGGVIFAHKDWISDYLSLKPLEESQKPFGCGESLRCAHGRLNPNEAGLLKLVTRISAEHIVDDLGYERDSLIVYTPEDICLTCVRLVCFEYYYGLRATEAARELKAEYRQINDNDGNNDRCCWVLREIVEKFGELANTAVTEAEQHLRAELGSRCHRVTLPPINNGMSQFFGLDVNNEPEPNSVDQVEKRGDASLRSNTSLVVLEDKVNRDRTAVAVSSLVGSKPNPGVDVAVQMGPTPTKRPKLSSSVDEISDDIVIRRCKTEESPTENHGDHSINGVVVDKICVENGNGSAESDFSTVSDLKAAARFGIAPELPQDEVVDVVHNAFEFVVKPLNLESVCRHGSVWCSVPAGSSAQANSGRKRASVVCGVIRVSDHAWALIQQFYPHAFRIDSPDFKICEECQQEANDEQQKNDRIREEAKSYGTVLGTLVRRSKRSKVDTALRPVYLVNASWCARLADWISGRTQLLVGGKTLNNNQSLCIHGRLEYQPHELAAEICSDGKSEWVPTKSNEWRFIKENFNVDTEVKLIPVIQKLQPKDSSNHGKAAGTLSSRSAYPLSSGLSDSLKTKPGGIVSSLKNFKFEQTRSISSSSSAITPEDVPELDAISIASSDTGETVTLADSENNEDTKIEEIISDDESSQEEEEDDDDDFAGSSKSKAQRGSRGGRGGRGRGRGRGKAAETTTRLAKSKRTGWNTSPGICHACRDHREEQRLRLAETVPEIPEWNGSIYVRFESNNNESLTPPTTSRRRRRTATANRKTAAIAGEELDYVVSSTWPLVEFQMAILDDFEISPFEQILYAVDETTKERRLLTSGDNSTLGELHIKENQSFILRRKEEEEEEEPVPTAVLDGDENGKKSKPNNRAEGFGGTLLSVLANAAPTKRSNCNQSS